MQTAGFPDVDAKAIVADLQRQFTDDYLSGV
jgi:hypothetical protein